MKENAMKKFKSLLGIIISLSLCVSMTFSVLAADDAADTDDAATDPIENSTGDYVRVVFDEAHKVSTSGNKNSKLWLHNAINNIIPAHEFVSYNGVDCTKATYESQGTKWAWIDDSLNLGMSNVPYIFTPRLYVDTANKYMVVTYASDSTASRGLYLWGAGSVNMQIAKNISVSDGKWTVTEPVEVSQDLLTRVNGEYIALYSNETAVDKSLYVREIIFFESLEDAKAYAEAAPAYLNPAEDDSADDAAKRDKLKLLMLLIGMHGEREEREEAAVPPPFDGVEGTYTVVKFTEGSTDYSPINDFYSPNATDPSKLLKNTTTEYLGVDCMEIDRFTGAAWVVTDAGGPGGAVPYLNLAFNALNAPSRNTKYFVVTYATYTESEDAASGDMYIWHNDIAETVGANKNKGFLVKSDIDSNDGWTTTGAIEIVESEDGIIDSLLAGKAGRFNLCATGDFDKLYVREIVFFNRYEDAVAYSESAADYYNGVMPLGE